MPACGEKPAQGGIGMSLCLHTDTLHPPALQAGQSVRLSGVIYTARDAAHQKLTALLKQGAPLPFPLRGGVLYYAGPTPAPPGFPIGACGPTTSGRMDPFTPLLLENGLRAMIGKGPRHPSVVQAIRTYGAVYFCAVGGAGALMASCVTDMDEVAFPELGCESVKRLVIRHMPLIVGIDSHGGDLFASGPQAYWREGV